MSTFSIFSKVFCTVTILVDQPMVFGELEKHFLCCNVQGKLLCSKILWNLATLLYTFLTTIRKIFYFSSFASVTL